MVRSQVMSWSGGRVQIEETAGASAPFGVGVSFPGHAGLPHLDAFGHCPFNCFKIDIFLTQPYQRGVSLFLLTSLTTTLKALDQWSEKFLCPGKNSKYFQLWRSCLLCYLYAILLLWNESKHRQHVNQRVWLYSNKTLGMDTEVWISRWNKILFSPNYLKR